MKRTRRRFVEIGRRGAAKIFEWKTYLITAIAVVSFSNFVAVLFGHTIPGIVVDFFRMAGEYVVLGAIFAFAMAWFIRAKPYHNLPKKYTIVPFDIYGKQSIIDGMRTEFKTHDVAWSYMRQYKIAYPLYNFALVSYMPNLEKPTIFRYI